MKKRLCSILCCVAILASIATAQTSGDKTFTSVTFPVYTLNATPVPGASLQVVGAPGQATWCYWAVANFQIGSVLSSLGCVQNAANTLTSSNYVSVLPWSYPAAVTSIDILATGSFAPPTGACACAVATGLTSGGTNQQSNTTSSYTVTLLNLASFNLILRNEVVGSASTHLLLRNAAGTLISDLSTVGSSALTGSGTVGDIPLWTGSTALGNSTLSDVTSGSAPGGGYLLSAHSIQSGGSLSIGNIAGGFSSSFCGTIFAICGAQANATIQNTVDATGISVWNLFTGSTISVGGGTFLAAIEAHNGYGGSAATGSQTMPSQAAFQGTSGLNGYSATNDYTFIAMAPALSSGTMTHHAAFYCQDQTAAGSGTNSDPHCFEEIGNAPNAFQGHMNQIATGNWAGSCAMVTATTCTFSITAAYTGTPLSFVSIDAASAPPATAIDAKCAVSGTTVTITAGASNSLTWDCLLIGNPN